ncbi:hypothetical protein EHI8A_207720 [Entamoeba histolytica HM-1:IMSS-B]|uniref:Uncharacterized protein n=6 Tax=Entamoeba histolytica TaxID=5759 RepID=B1N4P8_ENTH1|nr:hypothetical protein EHI_129500 [Entamoeba histolytica HM-1:IMSS]EMD43968.1 Hypothetical protein EHI5A_087800 [Entamoeba histolytica KU27]EMH72248.1 hypothetical protein EHI8A_207720 [Entamoeba histolytica HM-1:IMSS-B]EMS11325.1 hypothetical protein KM1_146300 [Entamoeba histolytica HM-3:IMSS]ENY63869.1 hypothetical protein EHI7A_179350 [Entamoeba histolytica HM-1:IMSS-A]GAT98710.1 hypothetical protein CL6EHI_129500 [Entamoeba histolytica]|eukprot:XP_001914164.1 hypothetical protein EHI_129500 [Entamoeba histolytica HM-1:IMSS]
MDEVKRQFIEIQKEYQNALVKVYLLSKDQTISQHHLSICLEEINKLISDVISIRRKQEEINQQNQIIKAHQEKVKKILVNLKDNLTTKEAKEINKIKEKYENFINMTSTKIEFTEVSIQLEQQYYLSIISILQQQKLIIQSLLSKQVK